VGAPATNPYRLLPSVEEALGLPELAALAARVPRELCVGFVQAELALWRGEIGTGALGPAELRERLERGDLARAVLARAGREERSGLARVVNATGVVLHTGLGRAPVHPEAARAMEQAARGYCLLEVDRASGERSQRDGRLSELLVRLSGAEAGLAVNNNAGAVLLCLNTFAQGRETIVSRGELVEIGGSFRIPDVMERAGTRLVEVGTTNRTRAEDYRRAAGPRTGLLFKVHRSNFRIEGFTEEVEPRELAELGRELDLPAAFDLGSGLFAEDGAPPQAALAEEPPVRASVAAGLDAVTFSGDKLLGGPQAGLVVGTRAACAAMRANPLYRALRLDKVTIAGLERTLELHLAGRAAELPTRAMLAADEEHLRARAEALAAELAHLAGLEVECARDLSQVGSGSAPGAHLPTWVVRVRAAGLSAARLAAGLRTGEPAVFARIRDERVLLDPRTLAPGEDAELVHALRAALGSPAEPD
jgi:L-seryl-tRNA(Ser) seleniumtransferase